MGTRYDALIIGSGQAGPSLAVRLASAGMKFSLIEREHLGGTCVNDGCMPTKTLVASARAAYGAPRRRLRREARRYRGLKRDSRSRPVRRVACDRGQRRDARSVAANLLEGEHRRTTDRIPAYALFTDPPLGRVGMTAAQVRAAGRPALVGVMPMSRVGRAKERGETQGFMKVLVDAHTERILGAALLCIEGDEIVHSLLDVMAADASYQVIRRSVHIHPTVSELIPTLLGSLTPL